MSTAGKKKMNEIVIKKTAPVRLIKCYVCNKHLSNQSEFNQHLEEHQSKLNRTSVEEIQRKTQESFRSKRQPSALMRTCSSKREEKKEEDKSSEKENLKEDVVEDEEQREVEDALRESQIMLERIEFLTQIADTPAQKSIVPVIADEDIEEQKTIQNEHELYLQLRSSSANAQTLILRTNFEQKYFQNYQEQLKHLRKLGKMAINPDSIAKISAIGQKISNDVLLKLMSKYSHINSKEAYPQKQQQIISSTENEGEVAYCSVCYTQIQVGNQFLHSQLGTVYHKECYEELS